MLKRIDAVLNGFTMYRLLVYGLGLLAFLGLLLSFMGTLTVSGIGLGISLILLLVSTYSINRVLARVWDIPTNSESWLITALILFFILPPTMTVSQGVMVFLAGVIAMGSKFIAVYHSRHIFNPAAFAAGVLVLTGLLHVTWWVGSSVLWPFTLAFGLLVVRKIRRTYLFGMFAVVSFVVTFAMSYVQHQSVAEVLKLAITSSPLIFLGTIMLTEPATMPPRKNQQLLFAALVALLYASQQSIFGMYIYPEVALLVGNVYAFAVGQKSRLHLRLTSIVPISEQVTDFVFSTDRPLRFLPGQYLEWTLPGVTLDGRGNRRTFTIASSPTENEIHLGVKFYEPSSSFKRSLRGLRLGDSMYAGQLAGNFTLPADSRQKLVFIAGGIGITPFRSMLKYLLDSGQKRDIILLYLVSKPEELAYKDVIGQAAAAGVCVVHAQVGGAPLTPESIQQLFPDWAERTYFLSGPNGMVAGVKDTLQHMNIPRKRIKTDYFAGY